jgi:hypothetical protein
MPSVGDDLSAALAEIRQRSDEATPGPWAWRGNIDTGDPYLTSRGYRDMEKPDGTAVRHHAGDVLGHIPVEVTREDAIRRGVGGPDSLPEPKISREPEDTYGERYDAALQAAQEAELEDYLTDEYGNPRTEQRMAFCTDWLYTDARKLVTFEVAPGVTDRSNPRVYRADITGIRHPDAEFIEHARSDVPLLLAAVDAVLALHKPEDEVIYTSCAAHVITGPAGRDPLRFSKMDDCPDCQRRRVLVCGHCDCSDWPCATYSAVLTALTGEGGTSA